MLVTTLKRSFFDLFLSIFHTAAKLSKTDEKPAGPLFHQTVFLFRLTRLTQLPSESFFVRNLLLHTDVN